MVDDPKWINADAGAPAYAADELRRLDAMGIYPGVADAFGARQGVRPHSTANVSLSGTTVTVEHTCAVMYPALTSTSGPYTVALRSEAHPLTAADGANPRKDIVVLAIEDDDEDSSGFRRARSYVVDGTPAATPTEPAVPSGAMRLATVDVPQSGGGSPTLTFNAPYTVSLGGILPVRDASELPTAGRYEGMYADQADTNELKRWTGSNWSRVASGVSSTTSTGLVTPATGWAVNGFRARKWGPLLWGLAAFERTGSSIAPGSDGNIGDALMGTINDAAWRPVDIEYGACGDGFSDGEFRIQTDGTVHIRSWTPGGSITAGRILRCTFVGAV